jgi:uncharacterized protein (TIGR04222 family)
VRQAMRGVLALAVVMLPLANANAAGAQTFGEQIRRYDVVIQITRDGALHIRESIGYDFSVIPRHGIFRDLPVRERFDGTHDRRYRLAIESVTADGAPAQVQTTTQGVYRHLRIGDPDHTITGLHRYQIIYTVLGAPLTFADHDELNWDAIGNQWPVPISNAHVTVIAPAPISQVACFSGPQGSSLPCDGGASAPGLGATFSQGSLAANAGLTVVVGMPKGTIQPAPAPILEERKTLATAFKITPLTTGLGGGLALFGLLVVVWLGTLRGRDRRYAGSEVDAAMGNATGEDEPVPVLHRSSGTIEFVPPDAIRPGEVGMLADEHANLLDVTATIVDLAVRGFLTITEVDPERHERHPDYELTATPGKGKGTPLRYEQVLLNKLFDNRTTVTLSALKYKFRTSLTKIQSEIYDDAVSQGWYRIRPDKTRGRWTAIGVVALLVGIGLTALVALTTSFGIVPLSLVVTAIALLVAASRMPSRTAKGTAMLSRVRGFRRLFDEGEEDTRARFAEQKDIFSQYLPYAIVFGCTKKWAKAFEGIAAEELGTDWYSGSHPFNALYLAHAVDHFGTAATGTMYASMPSSSGSSGFSGGFSGGGGGGGGGGSW